MQSTTGRGIDSEYVLEYPEARRGGPCEDDGISRLLERVGGTGDVVTRDEVVHYYAEIIAPLLTAIRDGATEILSAHADKGVQVQAPEQSADGRVLASSAVVLTRSGPDNSFTWLLVVGFENWNEFRQRIDWDASTGKFPTMDVPLKLSWNGRDRWGEPRHENLAVPSIRLTRERVSWLGRYWNAGAIPGGKWIAQTLLDSWLLQDSPESAERKSREATPGGRWERVKQLKAWGPNEVWIVRDSSDAAAPRRAMKMLRFRKGPGSTAYRRLVREIEITKELATKHPGIVPVLDFAIPQDGDEWTPFYVMPLAESTLATARDFKENLESVLRLGIALADALSAAHEQSVVHRDVKPDNILILGEERQPVIADFGICFLATEEGDRLTAIDAGTVGPANYVAPELLGGRADRADIDGRVDIYSLGKTLYYAYSGGETFPREYFADEEYDLRKKIDDPRLPHLYGLLERMVVEKRDGRFANMADCRSALERALDNIKRGNPYESGMYGEVRTPLEVMDHFVRDLRGASAVTRADLVRDVLRDAQKDLDASATHLDDSRALAGAEEMMIQAGFRGAERLLAVGLPLLGANDADGLGRWLEVLIRPFWRSDEPGRNRIRSLLRGASALGLHGAAVVTLHMERFAALRTILDLYLEHRTWFVHLAMFGNGATRSWAWVEGCVAQSAVLARFDPNVIPEIDAALSHVVGLSILRFFLNMDSESLTRLVPPKEGEVTLDALPGLFPQASQWVESLPEVFLLAPSRERAIGEAVFGLSPQDLRRECKRITPNLARALRWMASRIDRRPVWIGGIPRGGRWTEWCGGEV